MTFFLPELEGHDVYLQPEQDHAVVMKLFQTAIDAPKELRYRQFESCKWTAWSVRDYIYKKKSHSLPTMARGLFTAETHSTHRIVARGYDKFYNVKETRWTQWPALEKDTTGPYEITAKENGCIIFIAALSDSQVIVSSKHSVPEPKDNSTAHGGVGYHWLLQHLASVGQSPAAMAAWLWEHNLTLVAELCDDAFEEHVLAYPQHRRGLYLHGANLNTAQLHTLPSTQVHAIAVAFGLWPVVFEKLETLAEVKSVAEEVEGTGMYKGQEVEGVVVRCMKHTTPFFFKIKSEKYLMYREYRQVTKVFLSGEKVEAKYEYKKTFYYVRWLECQAKHHPEWFNTFDQGKGVIAAREKFEAYWQKGDLSSASLSLMS
ncbi:RNA ligase-domain-containing protein [Spinellus fusiger]|nr:RNA ligase-domain-containing protein [Spinellus fusiger]